MPSSTWELSFNLLLTPLYFAGHMSLWAFKSKSDSTASNNRRESLSEDADEDVGIWGLSKDAFGHESECECESESESGSEFGQSVRIHS